MSDVTLAAQASPQEQVPVLSGDLILPRTGTWTAHLDLERAPPVGRVVLRWLGTDLQGTVLRGGEYENRCQALVIGGAGGLAGELPARGYDHTVPLQTIVQQLLHEAGEQLAADADPALLSATAPAWARLRGPAGALLEEVLAQGAQGAVWRVQPGGAVWVGKETWPLATLTGQILDLDPAGASCLVAPGALCLLPGQVLQVAEQDQRRIGAVRYVIGPAQSRCRVWFQAGEAPADPLKAGLYALAREALRGVDYLACYPAKVVMQRGDGTLDLQPESDRIPPMTSVKPRVPCHGAKVTVPAGGRVLLGFDGGDPRYPHAALFEQGSGGKAVARVGDPCKIAGALAAWMGQVETALNLLAGGSVTTLSTTFLNAPGIEIAAGSPHLSLLPGSTP